MEGSAEANPSTDSSASPAEGAVVTAPTPERESGRRAGSPNGQAPAPTLNQIRYPCLTNMDYHAAREGWLDQIHRWLMFVVIIAGASALVDAWPGMKVAGPIIAALAGALDLTFDLSNRARNHAMIRRRYADILARATREPDRLAALQCLLDEIGGDEEPAFSAQLALSDTRAQNQTYGKIVHSCRPSLPYRLFANLFRFPGHDFSR